MNSETKERSRYPLSWPEHWPRTESVNRLAAPFFKYLKRHDAAGNCFGGSRSNRSMEDASRELFNELIRLGAEDGEILSTNVELRLDGTPYSNRKPPTDPGAAIYFKLHGREVSLACDKWLRVEDNVWAIAKHIEALRGQDRWGVGTIEQAFRGYMALPGVGESTASDWWKVLGVPINASEGQVKDAYRFLAKKHHPDKGGDGELFSRVQKAWEKFQSTLNGE